MNIFGNDLVAKAKRFRNAHWPRYVFIHINKTAGSSIERALNLRFEHKTAQEKRAELGSYRWSHSFKFSFVRNPWDKVYSHYNYRVATGQTDMGDRHITFRDWVMQAYGTHDHRYYDQPRMFMPQTWWLSDSSGHLMVDFIGRFERLADDFSVLCQHLGVTGHLPHLKQSSTLNYRDAYDAESRRCVALVFAPDILQFGYSF